jgi:hypothetical protein
MNEVLRKKIEQRAYELFMKRGGLHGYHVQDWAQAEKEVSAAEAGKKAAPVAAPVQPNKTAPQPKPEMPAKKSQPSKRK